MINIRKGLFETNSSSTHSLCISTNNNNLEIPNSLYFDLNNFAWEHDILCTPNEIGSYIYTGICELYTKEEAEDYKNYIYELLGDYGCEASFAEPEYSEWGGISNGSIDHCGELIPLLEQLRNSEKKLLRFIFSPDSFIVMGNDNDDWHDEKMEELDFSNVDIIEKGN